MGSRLVTAYPLGRKVEHDPRSRDYPAVRRVTAVRSVLWTHRAPVLDQGSLGMCTAAALAQCLNAAHFAHSRPLRKYLDRSDAADLYSLATQLDDFAGQWPTDDTGSSGLAVAKAGVRLGYLAAYHHAFGMEHFLDIIGGQPVIVGTDWYRGMWEADSNGYLHPDGPIVGGHEYLVLGADWRRQKVTMLNSWGKGWGRNGRAYISFTDFAMLLKANGDVTVPLGRI